MSVDLGGTCKWKIELKCVLAFVHALSLAQSRSGNLLVSLIWLIFSQYSKALASFFFFEVLWASEDCFESLKLNMFKCSQSYCWGLPSNHQDGIEDGILYSGPTWRHYKKTHQFTKRSNTWPWKITLVELNGQDGISQQVCGWSPKPPLCGECLIFFFQRRFSINPKLFDRLWGDCKYVFRQSPHPNTKSFPQDHPNHQFPGM